MESTTGIQKKIVELDPFGVEVIPDTEGNLHPVWSAGEEPPAEAGLVAVSVPLNSRSRYTVKVPLPVAGEGLYQSENGVVEVNYDPNTMEILPDGSLASKAAAGSAVEFGVHGLKLVPGLQVIGFSSGDADCHRTSVLVSPDNYPVNRQTALEEGDMVFPGSAKWVKAEAILTFTVPSYMENSWEYYCAFVVQSLDPSSAESETVLATYEFPFSLDTTEHISVIKCPVSLYNGSGTAIRLRTGIQWTRDGEPTKEISCTGKVTVSAI
jgi:hypothetical protein